MKNIDETVFRGPSCLNAEFKAQTGTLGDHSCSEVHVVCWEPWRIL